MDYINHITSLRTNKHLSYAERFFIEKSLQANMTKSAIATVLGRSRTTIYTEIRRGSVIQIKAGKAKLVYLADHGQLQVKSKFVCKLLLGTCGARGCSASLS